MPEPASPPAAVGRPVATSPPPVPPPGQLPSDIDVSALLAAREGLPVEARGQFRMALERFLHHKVALAGLGTFVFLLLLSIIGQHVWHYNYAQITSQFATGPSAQHPFGTDTVGHDLLAQVLAATATSIETAIIVAVAATILGTVVGAVAGYYGKWADSALMRFTDLILVLPALALLLVLANGVGSFASNGLAIALVLAALFWTTLARLVRGTFLSLREKEFVEAEWAIGASDRRIIFRHMIPNAAGPIVVNATLTVALAMLVEAALSFLGLGIQPPNVSLGLLIAGGEGDATVFPWLFYFPSIFLILAILSVNFMGDGLRDALDPTQRVRA